MIFLLPRRCPQLRFALGIRDAELRCLLLNFVGPPRKSFDRRRRNAGDFKIVSRALNAKAQFLQPVGQADAERRLKIRRVTFKFTKLPSFPTTFRPVVSCVEHEAMGMQLGIGYSVHWP